jgi:hypothetical protein
MGRHRKSRSKLPLLGVSIVVVAGIGIGVAAAGGSSDSDQPCVTSHGHCVTTSTPLTLPTEHPTTTKTTIPQPPPPGTKAAQVRISKGRASRTVTLSTGDQIVIACGESSSNYGNVQLTVTARNPTAQIYVTGSADITGGTGNGAISFGSNGVDNRYSAAHNVLNTLAPGSWDLSFSASKAPAILYSRFQVTHGRTSFAIGLTGASQPAGATNSCLARIQVTPAH